MTDWSETTTLFEVEGSEGYDWSIVQLISRPHGDGVQYAVYSDGGCSCSYPHMDSLESYGLMWHFDFIEARREAETDVRDMWGLNAAERGEALSELRMIKP